MVPATTCVRRIVAHGRSSPSLAKWWYSVATGEGKSQCGGVRKFIKARLCVAMRASPEVPPLPRGEQEWRNLVRKNSRRTSQVFLPSPLEGEGPGVRGLSAKASRSVTPHVSLTILTEAFSWMAPCGVHNFEVDSLLVGSVILELATGRLEACAPPVSVLLWRSADGPVVPPVETVPASAKNPAFCEGQNPRSHP
jgi:hypothetical protein